MRAGKRATGGYLMSDKWWRGDANEDFAQFLQDRGGAEPREIRRPECESCGCLVYRLHVRDQGARRHCVACGEAQGICGTDTDWTEPPPEPLTCTCGKTQFEIAVAYAEPPRLAVAFRCLSCGVMAMAMTRDLSPDTTARILETA